MTLGLSETTLRISQIGEVTQVSSPALARPGPEDPATGTGPRPGCSPLPGLALLGSSVGAGRVGPRLGWSLGGASSAGFLLFNIKSGSLNCIKTCVIIPEEGKPGPW